MNPRESHEYWWALLTKNSIENGKPKYPSWWLILRLSALVPGKWPLSQVKDIKVLLGNLSLISATNGHFHYLCPSLVMSNINYRTSNEKKTVDQGCNTCTNGWNRLLTCIALSITFKAMFGAATLIIATSGAATCIDEPSSKSTIIL